MADAQITPAPGDAPTRSYPGHGAVVGCDLAHSRPWWPEPRRPPSGSPNIVVVLLDDMGYSDIGPFGSEIPTPTLDRLASRGLRLTNYHTTPLCSPARAALLTGLNPHRAGYASVANFDPGFPGYTMELADDVVTLPEVLRANGYPTFAVGKWHLTRDAAMHDGAPRHTWPCQRGFDRFYGFLEGLTNLHQPHRLVRDNSPRSSCSCRTTPPARAGLPGRAATSSSSAAGCPGAWVSQGSTSWPRSALRAGRRAPGANRPSSICRPKRSARSSSRPAS
jgi:hypothetical protein